MGRSMWSTRIHGITYAMPLRTQRKQYKTSLLSAHGKRAIAANANGGKVSLVCGQSTRRTKRRDVSTFPLKTSLAGTHRLEGNADRPLRTHVHNLAHTRNHTLDVRPFHLPQRPRRRGDVVIKLFREKHFSLAVSLLS
uniref:Uncharacterized protein n=1 Tax=Rhipicephalus zambeziensis TaxID=60191 RepID=A0A224YCJ9_9ACAR